MAMPLSHARARRWQVVFDQRQGLWFMRRGWEEAIQQPSTPDFFAWLVSQHNGAKPGDPAPNDTAPAGHV